MICLQCEAPTSESLEPETILVGEDHIEVSGFKVPVIRCSECDFAYTDWRAEGIHHQAVCDHFGLLRPNDVRAIRDDLSREEFATILGIKADVVRLLEVGSILISNDLNRAIVEYAKQETSLYCRGR